MSSESVPESRTLLARLVLIRPGEGRALAWSAAYFFLLLFSYYLQRPLRDALGISGDLDDLPWLWTGTTAAMLVAVPLFALLVSRLPRRRFIPLTYRFFALNIITFFVAFLLVPQRAQVAVGYAYYIWLSVFNLFAVAVFWGFMADLYRPEQGKRLFGAVAVGGTLGAIAGSSVPAAVLGLRGPDGEALVDPIALLPIAAVLLELATRCVLRLVPHAGLSPEQGEGVCPCCEYSLAGLAPDRPCPECGAGPEERLAKRRQRQRPPGEPGRGVLTGIAIVVRSPYLVALAVYMLIYTLTSTFLWFEQAAIVKDAFTDRAGRTAFFARVDLVVNVLTLLTQIFLTGRLMRNLGVGVTLGILPVLTGLGFAALAYEPTLAVLAAFYAIRRATHFAVDRPSREVLYTVLGPDEKYKSKSFIDTFVYRGGDLLGAWTHGLLSSAAGGLAMIVIPLSAVWLGAGIYLGRRQRSLAAGAPPQPAAAAATA